MAETAKTDEAKATEQPPTPDEVEKDDNAIEPTNVDEWTERGSGLTAGEVIARRSPDMDEPRAENGKHVKVFVLPPGPKPTEANGYDHSANKAAVRQYAISSGLRPTGDVEHVSTSKTGPGNLSWALKYEVPVVPAGIEDYSPDHAAEVITENETDENGNVPVNTDGNGNTPSTKPTE